MATRPAPVSVDFCDQLERHQAEMFGVSASAMPGGEVTDLGGATFIASGTKLTIPLFNRVFCVRTSAARSDMLIKKIVGAFARLDLPSHVHLSPASTPPEFGDRLVAASFLPRGREATMYHDGETPGAADQRIRVTVVEPKDRDTYLTTLNAGFETPSFLWAGLRAVFEARAASPAFTHYVAQLDARPVGVATLFRSSGDVGGLYQLATLPRYRGRGVATALTTRALADSCARGDDALCLQVLIDSPAEALFSRLGFRRAYLGVDYIRQG